MIFYLTFNDLPSGIFSSQVIDVVKFFRSELKAEIKLVSFISLRNFYKNRKKIKGELSDAVVLPMFPGVHRWRLNAILLKIVCVLLRPEKIIARSVLATQLAFKSGVKNIVYDGRGAIAAEWKEYSVITNPQMLSEIEELEKRAVLNSQFRIAVSHQLVKHWQKEFNYSENNHIVIPCTLNTIFEQIEIIQEQISEARKKLCFTDNDIVFFYSGSLAGWQSFGLLYSFVKPILQSNIRHKLFFLAEADKHILQLQNEFPKQVFNKKISPDEVPKYLMAGDYGLLIRDETITNKVASPVKFAEYLACGLNVIISENLGDYSEFVLKNNCGNVYLNFKIATSVSIEQKQKNRNLALKNFTKINLKEEYQKVL